MARDVTIAKFKGVLFNDVDEITLTDAERSQLLRIRAIYTMQLSNPTIANNDVVVMLQREFGVGSLSQAYRDIAQTHALLGSVPNASKQWIRYMVVEALKQSVACADSLIENSDDDAVIVKAIEAKIKAADKLAKYTRLDKADPDAIPYEDIVPIQTEFTTDPSVMGVKIDDPHGLVERVKKKYLDFQEL